MPGAWAQAEKAGLKRIRGVCLDIDETLSTRGKLTAEAYSALWSLKDAGLWVVPITGRPAGWCDQIARFWPVDAVVGENGAFTFFMENTGGPARLRRLITPGAEENPRPMLEKLGREIKKRFPEAMWASDQAYREYDLAIDICEDVEPWAKSQVDDLLTLCSQAGAHAKLSSIHVNAWFGEYDKRKGFEHWLGHRADAPRPDEWLFIGDSPNDEPMFAAFQSSVGVANLAAYVARLKHPPRWITSRESGAGFAEMARSLIQARS